MTYEQNPYFQGFCGEHDSKYPGVKQACGATLYILPTCGKKFQKLSVRLLTYQLLIVNMSSRGPFLPSMAMSHSISAPVQYTSTKTSEQELRLLEALAHGNRIEEWDYQSLLEVCDGCGHFFLMGALSASVWKSGLRTGKRLGLDRTWTSQDQKSQDCTGPQPQSGPWSFAILKIPGCLEVRSFHFFGLLVNRYSYSHIKKIVL